MARHVAAEAGKVYLVGAGPGAPGLITLRGVECLRRADLVLYDYLVNPRILQHAPAGAERICLGRHGGARLWSQEAVNDTMVRRAQAGHQVVRLKGGDPAVFARASEELDALLEHHVAFEIVPGITAALAAGSYAGVTVTHRQHASAVALVTGQETRRKSSPGLDYALLAQFPGTLVIYMGVTTADAWVDALIAGGKSPDTPALVIRHCSLAHQQTLCCTLGKLPEQFRGPQRLRPPVVVVIGDVVGLPRTANWFEQLPLFGQRILVTRPAAQAEALGGQFEELGADVWSQPAIELREPADWSAADEVLERLSQFDWIVYSSVNGVHAFMKRMQANGQDLRALGPVRLAAIGPATADALARYHLRADRCPQRYQAEDLADELARDAGGQRFLLVRASRGREILGERLLAAGADVEQVVFYESVDVREPAPDVHQAMRAGQINWTTVTSSAIARSLDLMFSSDLAATRLVSISPVTSATLRQLGWEPAAEAREATMAGVVEAVLECVGPEAGGTTMT